MGSIVFPFRRLSSLFFQAAPKSSTMSAIILPPLRNLRGGANANRSPRALSPSWNAATPICPWPFPPLARAWQDSRRAGYRFRGRLLLSERSFRVLFFLPLRADGPPRFNDMSFFPGGYLLFFFLCPCHAKILSAALLFCQRSLFYQKGNLLVPRLAELFYASRRVPSR